MIAGAGAGLISAVFVNPLDVVKIRLQNQSAVVKDLPGHLPAKKGTFSMLGLISKEEGVRGLFRGISATTVA